MDVRRTLILGVGSGFAIFAVVAALPAEGDSLIATVGKPAIVTAAPAEPQEGLAANKGPPRIVVDVAGYQPAQKGSVRGVVKIQKADGTEQEIGTFGVFPDTAFKAKTSRSIKYGFPLPPGMAAGPVRLKIEVVPGMECETGEGAQKECETGEGAQMEIGHAEIQ